MIKAESRKQARQIDPNAVRFFKTEEGYIPFYSHEDYKSYINAIRLRIRELLQGN